MKRIVNIVIVWMLLLLGNTATGFVAPLMSSRDGTLPPDTIPPDSVLLDSLLRDSLLQDSLSKLPSRGRIMSAHRNYRNPRNKYINPLDSIMAVRRRAADSVAEVQKQQEELRVMLDTLKVKVDSEQQKRQEVSVDSLKMPTESQDSILPALPDAVSLRGFRASDDTVAVDSTQSGSALDFPVKYEAKDSTIYLPNDGFAHFYGSSKVNYQKIELASEVISMSVDSSIVRAYGVVDSTGVIIGKPVFKEGGDQYISETMSYNFKTKKGYITNVDTQQGDGFLTSERSKKGENDELFLEHGRYTTCDEEHPHFYIAMSRAKVRPQKDVVTGPFWLVVEDVPLPFALPFGFFPFSSSYSSGFIMPSYGDDSNRGFYLRDGGYYFAISDYMDLKATGELYTKGSWGVNLASNYSRRYKYRGNFSLNYQVYVTGEKNMPDYSKQKSFRIQWSHSQDSKANPNSTFSASVNYSTSSYDKNSMSSLYDPTQYAQSTKTSSISYSRTFSDIGLTLSSSANVSMSSRDSSISMTLPDLNITLARFYPFKRKMAAGKERWYEKIAMSYSGQLSNSISTKESELLHKNLFKDWRNGFRHSIPVSASFTLFKYINVTPSVNYQERWYSFKENRSWDEGRQVERRDTIFGFNRVYNWSMSLAATTKLYGFYKPWRKLFGDKIQMIRHVVTPNISYSYAPDFSASRYGYYETYLKTDAQGNVSTVQYSPYSGGLYGVPGSGKTGSISMSVGNNVEMKVRNDRDSTGIKKVSLIDELTASLSYNMAAKERKWSDLTLNARLKLTKNYTFNMSAVFATYAYALDAAGKPFLSNETEWSRGRFGRFQGTSQHFSYTLNNDTFKKLFGKKNDSEKKGKKSDAGEENDAAEGTAQTTTVEQKEKKEAADTDTEGYMKFKMPWSLSISYSVTMAEDKTEEKFNTKSMRYPYKLTHQLNFSGNLKLSDAWNINYSSGYDFTFKRLSTTTVNISRDLHCFALSGGLVLSSYGATSYNFTIRATASTLADALKWDKRSGVNNAVQWY